MITFDANQQRVVDSTYLEVDWLFKITDSNSVIYYWSTKKTSVVRQTYTYRIIDFRGITINRRNSGSGIQSPGYLTFTASNKNNSLTASDFIGGIVELTLRGTDSTGTEDLITWKFDIRKAEPAYQQIIFTCEDFLQKYLRGTYPNTRYILDLFPSDADSEKERLCVPIPIGTCYIPLRPIYYSPDAVRYYFLGPNNRNFTISKIRTPRQLNHKSVYDSGTYTFNVFDFKHDIDGTPWKVMDAIIADANNDGTADAPGFWKDGNVLLDAPTKFSRDDTEDFGGSTGTHDGGDGQPILGDSGATWTANAFMRYYVVNTTKDKWAKVTTNDGTTITGTLSDGADWDDGDGYYICGPASIIKYVLMDMGISHDDIDDTSFGEAEVTFASWGINWNGAFWYIQDREEVLATLLNMCHSTISVRDKIYLRVLSKTSQLTLGKGHITKKADVGAGSFSYRMTLNDNPISDSGYVAWQEPDEPQDEFKRSSVPVKSTKDEISNEELLIPFVQDSQHVQKLGILWLQRILLVSGIVTFSAKPKCLALEPDDVITISHADYGGTYDVLIESIDISKDLGMSFDCVTFSDSLDDWDDLNPDAITIADDADSANIWQPVISGPGSEQTGDSIPNLIRGNLRIGSGVNYVGIYPSDPVIKIFEGANENVLLGKIGVNQTGILIGNEAVGDYLKYDGTTLTLSSASADGIVIKDGANVKIESGGDLILVGDDTNASRIGFIIGSNYFYIAADGGSSSNLSIYPDTAGGVNFLIGHNVEGDLLLFNKMSVAVISSIAMLACEGPSAGNKYASLSLGNSFGSFFMCRLTSKLDSNNWAEIEAYSSAANNFCYLYAEHNNSYMKLQVDATNNSILITSSSGTEDLEIIDAGSAGATQQDWIEVEVGGNVGYIRVYSSK